MKAFLYFAGLMVFAFLAVTAISTPPWKDMKAFLRNLFDWSFGDKDAEHEREVREIYERARKLDHLENSLKASKARRDK